jgi:glutamate-ammonia-ligase adenylyltransferase
MPRKRIPSGWNILPPLVIPVEKRLDHVRLCSDFAAGLLDRFPGWVDGIDDALPPDVTTLAQINKEHTLQDGLRIFRNREMLRIIWRDLCGLATLRETFSNLTTLAEICLQAAVDEHHRQLEQKHGTPRGEDGSPQRIFVIALGKFGGGELNLSSDIDVMFCYAQAGQCDGRKNIANDQFFTRLARAVIASLSEITHEGFCFRVDTRLRPFGDSGPLTSSLASLEQYYQREGRDWERYALIKARPVAGDSEAGARFMQIVKPFVYRRYIDYSSVEALQEMHSNLRDDARRKDRLDDIKRGPGGIREIEFLAQCFQILRGGRESSLQTPSLDAALVEIGRLDLMQKESINEIRQDYAFLRFLENRIQALRDQQTHRVPGGEDRERIALAMNEKDVGSLDESLSRTRERVRERFQSIFPSRPEPSPKQKWAERWQQLHADRQSIDQSTEEPTTSPLGTFMQRLGRVVLSQRANLRLDRFMPGLLERIDKRSLSDEAINRAFDLVLAICRRSAYLVLLVQHPKALDRMLDLFAQSDWIAAKVIRFPALLDELIDPALGRQIPDRGELQASVDRILEAAQGTEAVLEGLNYLKLATELRIAVGQLEGSQEPAIAQETLSSLAAALLSGVLEVAGKEIVQRHGGFADGIDGAEHHHGTMGIIGYGTLGAGELGLGSDLDIVFLFESAQGSSDGHRPLPPERYYARMAQRVLSFLTVMTPSGRLYEVDTRLRPNGRAGSLVSSVHAFREYQRKEAWTWELQALSRARFIAGCNSVSVQFSRIRQEVLCRQRDEAELAAELLEMRRKIDSEHARNVHFDARNSPKSRQGGIIDIEFIAQLGVLATARPFPRVLKATGTAAQLEELCSIGWLSEEETAALQKAFRQLRKQQMMAPLVKQGPETEIDTGESVRIFEQKLGGSH